MAKTVVLDLAHSRLVSMGRAPEPGEMGRSNAMTSNEALTPDRVAHVRGLAPFESLWATLADAVLGGCRSSR